MSLFERKSITLPVGGKQVQFFPLSIGNLYRLKTILAPVANLIATLFAKKQNDNASMVERSTDPNTGAQVEIAHVAATDVELAKFRAQRQDKLVAELMEALFSDANKMIVGRLLTDSIHSQWDHKLSDHEVLSFMENLDLSVTFELLGGIVKANAGVFGPLGARLAAMVATEFEAKVKNAAASEPERDVSDEPEQQPNEQTAST